MRLLLSTSNHFSISKKNILILSLVVILTFLFTRNLSAQGFSLNNEIDILLLKEDYKNASIALETAILKDSTNAALMYKSGIAYKHQFLLEKAISSFRKCLTLDSNMTAASMTLADCYYNTGASNNARDIYKKIFGSDSTHFQAGSNLASIYIENEDYAGAIKVYKMLILSNSTNDYLYKQLGLCYTKTDSLNASMRHLNKALKLNGNNFSALRILINNYIKDGIFKLAETTLLNRYVIDSMNVTINKLLGEVYFGWKNYDKAVKFYSRAEFLGDTTAYTYSKLGISYFLNAGTIDSLDTARRDSSYILAREALLKSIYKEYSPVTGYFLAMANLRLKDYESAVELFNGALKIMIPNIMYEVYIHLSESYKGLSDYSQEVEALKNALFYKKEQNDILLNIAELYQNELSDSGKALKYYNEYLDKNTGDAETVTKVKQIIKKLKQK